MRDPYGFITYGPRVDPVHVITTILLIALGIAGVSWFASSVGWVHSQWTAPPAAPASLTIESDSAPGNESRGTNTINAVPIDPEVFSSSEASE